MALRHLRQVSNRSTVNVGLGPFPHFLHNALHCSNGYAELVMVSVETLTHSANSTIALQSHCLSRIPLLKAHRFTHRLTKLMKTSAKTLSALLPQTASGRFPLQRTIGNSQRAQSSRKLKDGTPRRTTGMISSSIYQLETRTSYL